MIIINDYVYRNIKLDEIGCIIENTRVEYNQKYGGNYRRRIEITCIIKFLDKKTKQKILRSSVITCLESIKK